MAEYIERGALMQFPIRRNHYDRKNGNKHFINGIESVLEYAENLPAADVAPVVHSYWEHKITSDGENIGICHNCKYPVSWSWEIAKYCLNCGAKMDETVEDDER